MSAPVAPSDEIYAEDIAAIGTVERRPARTLILRIFGGPARMLARIHAIEHAIMDGDIVRIAGPSHEFHDLHHLAIFGIVADQLGRIAFVKGHIRLLRAGALPQPARRGIEFDAMNAVL